MKYPVIIHKSKYGYDVYCPMLPICHSRGDCFNEALENIKNAIEMYFEMVQEETQKTIKKSKNYFQSKIEVRV